MNFNIEGLLVAIAYGVVAYGLLYIVYRCHRDAARERGTSGS